MQCSDFSISEKGSLAPLGIGLAMLSLLTVLSILSAGSLYLTERRLTGVAESTALAVLSDASDDLSQSLEPLATAHLRDLKLSGLNGVSLVEVSSTDLRTVRVRLCSSWLPIFPNYIFSETGKVCSEALARRGR